MNTGLDGIRRALPAILLSVLAAPAVAAAEDAKSIVGVWRGTSTCVNREAAPACRDEEVIYEFRELTPPVAGKLSMKADKVVNSKVEPMGELDFAWEPKEKAWSCDFQTPRFHGLWSYRVLEGGDLAGTL